MKYLYLLVTVIAALTLFSNVSTSADYIKFSGVSDCAYDNPALKRQIDGIVNAGNGSATVACPVARRDDSDFIVLRALLSNPTPDRVRFRCRMAVDQAPRERGNRGGRWDPQC